MSDWIWALIIGFVLDLLLGDPAWLYHPVCIIGKYIGWMEKKLRRRGGNLRKSAVFLTASTVLLTMAVVALILMLCGLLGYRIFLNLLCCYRKIFHDQTLKFFFWYSIWIILGIKRFLMFHGIQIFIYSIIVQFFHMVGIPIRA